MTKIRLLVFAGIFQVALPSLGQECCCDSPPIQYLTEAQATRIESIVVRYLRFSGDPLHPATINIGIVGIVEPSSSTHLRFRLLIHDETGRQVMDSASFTMQMPAGKGPHRFSDVTFCESSKRLESILDRRTFDVLVLNEDGNPMKHQPQVEHQTELVSEPPGTCDPGWDPELLRTASVPHQLPRGK